LPTPSQEENDLVAMGVPVDKIEKRPTGARQEETRTMWPAQDDDRRRG